MRFALCEFYFSKKQQLRNLSVFNGLESDQVRHIVGPYLGPNCLHRHKYTCTSVQVGVLFGKVGYLL